MRIINRVAGLAVLGVMIVGAGCGHMQGHNDGDRHSSGAKTAHITPSLYDRLGKKEAITAVVNDFVGRVAADTRINGRFKTANIPRLNVLLVEQICEASGGPCSYTGRDMKTTHAGMNLTNAEFDALGEDLIAALDHFRVPAREKNDLLGALGPMRQEIVGQ